MSETKPAFMLVRELTAAEEPRAKALWVSERDAPTHDGWHLDGDTDPWRVWTLRTDYKAAKADLDRLLAGPPALDAMEAAKELRDLARTTAMAHTVYPDNMARRLRAIAEGLERGAGVEKRPRITLENIASGAVTAEQFEAAVKANRRAAEKRVADAELHRLRDEFRQMADDLATDGGRVNALGVSDDIDRILAGGEYRT